MKLKATQLREDEFVEIFGGLDVMQKRYPQTYKAYNNTMKQGGVMGNADYDYEIVSVCYTDSSKTMVAVEVQAMASDAAGYVIAKVSCPQAEPAEQNDTLTCNFTGDFERARIEIPASAFKASPTDDIGAACPTVLLQVYDVDSMVALYQDELTLSEFVILEEDSEYEITAPKMKDGHKSEDSPTINIAYNYRSYFPSNVLDYFYERSVMRDHMLRVPSEGKISSSGLDIRSIMGVKLMLTSDDKSSVVHQYPMKGVEVQDSNTIIWKHQDDWGIDYTELMKGSVTTFADYALIIQASVGNSGKMVNFNIKSAASGSQNINQKTIPRLQIYRDCLLPGVKITLGNTVPKEVERFHEGDIVLTPEGETTVQSVQKRYQSCAVVAVETKGGKSVSVSENHPFQTDKGLVCAKFMQEGMVVRTIDGDDVVSHVCASMEAEREVWSITLERGIYFYANGIVVGDSAAEMNAAELANNLRYRVPEAWRDDYDSWVERNILK